MKFNTVIELDIWSNFGCFSKPFSTAGILTHLIPPKTSVIGMIGAVLGYEFDDYESVEDVNQYKIEELYDIKISIQPLFDLKSKRVTFNRVSGTLDNINISNIRQDVLIKPYYKLFLAFPDSLSENEELFIKRIKNHETVFNLYMGRNEFPLSYNFIDTFDYESILLNKNNCSEFFSEGNKIYGSLNRNLIKYTSLGFVRKINRGSNVLLQMGSNNYDSLESYYEFLINEFPVKRSNFTDFTYSPLSFYSSREFKDCFFKEIVFKDNIGANQSLELTSIGENEWISMI